MKSATIDRPKSSVIVGRAPCQGVAETPSVFSVTSRRPVVGANALPLDPRPTAQYRKNKFHTAKDIADFVIASMPPKGPKPTLDQYLDILAFDLKANGIDLAGKPALTPDSLASIVFIPSAGQRRDEPRRASTVKQTRQRRMICLSGQDRG